jgi:hypothetical protein
MPMSIIELPESPSTSTDYSPDGAPLPPAMPTVKEVRSNFIEKDRTNSTFKGFTIFIVPAMIYMAAIVGLLRTSGWMPKLCCATVVALCIDMLFLIGHDACHQALTPNAWLNRIIGRLAFLPSLHPYSIACIMAGRTCVAGIRHLCRFPKRTMTSSRHCGDGWSASIARRWAWACIT